MRKIAVAAALAFVGTAAFAQDVKTDFDKSANFANIKTFTAKIGTSSNNQISEKRVLDEITQALTEKGWKSVDANPDALVLLHGATEKQKSLNTFYSGGGYGGSATAAWAGWAWGNRHHDDLRVPGRHPGRGHLRREVEGAHVPRHGHGRALGQPEKNAKKLQKASDKLFKDFLRAPRRRSSPWGSGGRQPKNRSRTSDATVRTGGSPDRTLLAAVLLVALPM